MIFVQIKKGTRKTMHKKVSFILSWFLLSTGSATASGVIDVSRFGAFPNDNRDDSRAVSNAPTPHTS